jgi:hypothetical protein
LDFARGLGSNRRLRIHLGLLRLFFLTLDRLCHRVRNDRLDRANKILLLTLVLLQLMWLVVIDDPQFPLRSTRPLRSVLPQPAENVGLQRYHQHENMEQQAKHDGDLQRPPNHATGQLPQQPDRPASHNRNDEQPGSRVLPPVPGAEGKIRRDRPHQEPAEQEQRQDHRPKLLINHELSRGSCFANDASNLGHRL